MKSKIDNSKEILPGITDGHQNYQEFDCKVKIVIDTGPRKLKAHPKVSRNSRNI